MGDNVRPEVLGGGSALNVRGRTSLDERSVPLLFAIFTDTAKRPIRCDKVDDVIFLHIMRKRQND